jgi:hypothetical protein
MEAKCLQCGVEFEIAARLKRYCSPKCQQKAWKVEDQRIKKNVFREFNVPEDIDKEFNEVEEF